MITYASITNNGDRKINEDSIGITKNNGSYCFMLCDGLGGHGMGDVASSMVTEVFLNNHVNMHKSEEIKFLNNCFLEAQENLLVKQNEKRAKSKMKTTAVCFLVNDKKAYVGYIGDSRFYAFAKNTVKLQTNDHSVPYMLYKAKEISENEIRNHPERNKLLKVMGSEWNYNNYEICKPLTMKKYDAFLLCSDGFWELITEAEMCATLADAKNVDGWLDNMTDIIKRNGVGKEMDNYSAIAIFNFKG